jgi:uncharacterized protein (DUF1330 family)
MAYVGLTKEAFATFRAMERSGPIHMLNLIRLRERANYPDGRVASGVEAYAAYGRESAQAFTRLGGKIIWRGRFEQMLIGPADEAWDVCFIAEYPSSAAFVELIKDPSYRAAVSHRAAATLESRLIRLAATSTGQGFHEE